MCINAHSNKQIDVAKSNSRPPELTQGNTEDYEMS